MMQLKKKVGLLVALGIGLGSMAQAASNTDSVTISATKPAASVALSLVNSSDVAVTALSFGTLTAGVAASANTTLIAKLVYSNVGADADNLSVAFTTTLPAGYALQYVATSYAAGVAGAAAAAVAYTTAYTGTLQSALYGAGTAFMTQSGATSAATLIGDASQLTFKLTADSSVTADLSGTLTATITAI